MVNVYLIAFGNIQNENNLYNNYVLKRHGLYQTASLTKGIIALTRCRDKNQNFKEGLYVPTYNTF